MPAKKKKPVLNLILLGDPGAGKATQAALLSKKYSFFDFDMGRELTLQRQNDPKIDAIHRKITDKGNLTPTKIVRGIIRDKLSNVSSEEGVVFDGFPKMLGEAKIVAGIIKKTNRPKPLVIYIALSQEEIVDRTLNRKGYASTKFSKRPDDTVQGLKNRARYYRKNIKEVVEFFKTQYKFVKINGSGTRQEVAKRISKAIQEHSK